MLESSCSWQCSQCNWGQWPQAAPGGARAGCWEDFYHRAGNTNRKAVDLHPGCLNPLLQVCSTGLALPGAEDLISSIPFNQHFSDSVKPSSCLLRFFPLDKPLSSGPGHKSLIPNPASLHCRFKDESHGYGEGNYISVSMRESGRLNWYGKIWKVLEAANNTDRDP